MINHCLTKCQSLVEQYLQTSAMETENVIQTSKRVLVDPDTGKDVPDPKWTKIELNDDLKYKVLTWIANTHCLLRMKIMGTEYTSTQFDIDIGDQTQNIFFTTHQILRQRANKITGNIESKVDSNSFKVTQGTNSYLITKDDAIKIVRDEADRQWLIYKSSEAMDKKNNWYGVAGPWMDFFAGFKLRVKELRIGHEHVVHSRTADKTTQFSVSTYGTEQVHHILLEGATFSPEKKSSMVQSLGPLTTLLCYVRSDSKYSDKWKVAARRVLAHVPEINSILEVIHGKRASEIKLLIKEIGNLLLLITGRQVNRMFFPPTCFALITNTLKNCNVVKDGNLYCKTISTAGAGGFAFYNEISRHSWSMSMGTCEVVAQIFFHGIFGTYKEDFGVLSAVTSLSTWFTREQIGEGFKAKQKIRLKPIDLIYCSKMCAANQSKLLTGSYQQISCAPVFSGKRVHIYSEDLFIYLTSRSNITRVGKSISELTNLTRETIDGLIDLLSKRGETVTREWGTTSWHRVSEITEGNKYGPEETEAVQESGKFFLSRS